MWQITVAGILAGFCPGVFVGAIAIYVIAWWATKQEQKRRRKEVADTREAILKAQNARHKEFKELVETDQTD